MLNLVLVGYMGVGKSTVGRKLAKRLGMKFVDTDHEVEHVTGLTVSEIFKKYGEIRFRSEEKAAVRRITRDSAQVIATGGGAVLDPENMEMLKENGILVCLTAKPETIYERVKRKKNRPLLMTDDPLATIREMLAQREPFYAQAGMTVDTSELDLEHVVFEVGKFYRAQTNQKRG